MAEEVDVKVPAERGQTGPFQFGTGLINQLVVKTSTGFVLDVEDSHFNNNRCVLLPDLRTDGEPSLDERRITGLGVLFAAYVHAEKNSSQGLFITGHTDPSGTAAYNQTLSEKRAKNVSLLIRGDRDGWRQQSNEVDNVDDIQTILTWQHKRGWDCDPGPINNVLNAKTRAAIGSFQRRYNEEVKKATDEGLDSPFKKTIDPDKKVGPETWGAFYDVYMTELMDLLEIQNFSELEQRQKKLKAPSGMPDFVGCGEHIPFDPALRNEATEDGDKERTEGLVHDRSDRRVELLFFDPGEQVKLVCHPQPGQCKPQDCPIYKKNEFDFDPIEIPPGLDVAEANIKLTFVDPTGAVRPFPEGLTVELKFGDPETWIEQEDEVDFEFILEETRDEDDSDGAGDATKAEPEPESKPPPDGEDSVDQEPSVVTGPGGVLRFVMPRKAHTCFLRILAGDTRFITADPKKLDDQQLVDFPEALKQAGNGRFFFRIPKEFTTLDGFWKAPSDVKFDEGMFLDIDGKKTKIGSRDAPAELKLDIQWQFFRFEYFDRWTSSVTAVPQGRPPKNGGDPSPVLSLMGHAVTLDPLSEDEAPADAHSAWTSGSGKDTVFCLGWVRRGIGLDESTELRDVPDADCLVRFKAAGLFVRTAGDGKSPDAERDLVQSPPEATKLGVDRLRVYDLPFEWWSTDFPVRFPGETVDKVQPFQKAAATKSTLAKPYVVPLDTIVLEGMHGNGPDTDVVWDKKIENRIGIYDNTLSVYHPDTTSGETYFTDLTQLKKQPDGPVLHDFPPFTRMIARGAILYDVFDQRTSKRGFGGFPIGARCAQRFSRRSSFRKSLDPYQVTGPDGSAAGTDVFGLARTTLLRCCGHDGNVEIFSIFQYASLFIDFKPPPDHEGVGKPLAPTTPEVASPAVGEKTAANSIIAVNKRWNGQDDFHKDKVVFHIGKPEIARGRWTSHFVRGAPMDGTNPGMINVPIYQKGYRANTGTDENGKPISKWAFDDLQGRKSGWYTAAHEMGHAYSLPDEYLNRDYKPSLEQPNIVESARSPGAPYGLDHPAMMVENARVRTRNFWHLVGWFRDAKHGGGPHFEDVDDISIVHGKFTFRAALAEFKHNPVQFPAASDLNASFRNSSFCDRFLYLTGHDAWTAGSRDDGGMDDTAQAHPYDGFIVLRVKMAWTFATTSDFEKTRSMLWNAHLAIQARFNDDRVISAVGSVNGKPVRLRVLFAPRFISRTFPTGDAKKVAEYLKSMERKVTTKDEYDDFVQKKLIEKHLIHAEVRVVKDGKPGLAQGGGTPHSALVREDEVKDDTVLLFSQLVGLKNDDIDSANDFKEAVSGLPPFVLTKMDPIVD